MCANLSGMLHAVQLTMLLYVLVFLCAGCVAPRGVTRKSDAQDVPNHSEAEAEQDAKLHRDETVADQAGTAEAVRGSDAAQNGEVSGATKKAQNGEVSGATKKAQNGEVQGTAAGVQGGSAASSGGGVIGRTSGDAAPVEPESEQDATVAEPSYDSDFSSITSKSLVIAEGNKWYYKNFDRRGRPSFAVLYDAGEAIEKTEWVYTGSARTPSQKKIIRAATLEISRYDEAGRETSIEHYEGKTRVSKVEKVYTVDGKLKERTITKGKTIDRSVWEFTDGKAITETKYRNGKKNAFIELHTTPHIVHLYVDGREVYVGEQQ